MIQNSFNFEKLFNKEFLQNHPFKNNKNIFQFFSIVPIAGLKVRNLEHEKSFSYFCLMKESEH